MKLPRIIILCLFFALLLTISRHLPDTYSYSEATLTSFAPPVFPYTYNLPLLKEIPEKDSRTEQVAVPSPAATEKKPAGEKTDPPLLQTPPQKRKIAPRKVLPAQETKPAVALPPAQREQPPLPDTPVQEKSPEKQAPTVPNIETHDRKLNTYVLEVIQTYQTGEGRYPYLLNNDYANYNGVTVNISYQGRLLARAHPSGNRVSHCVGITFEVFFRAMQERNRQLGLSPDNFNGMTWDEMFDFLLLWYVAAGPKETSNVAVAVEKYGLGTRITNLEEARPGDFIDFSRTNGTGHTAIFIDWVRKEGRIIGIHYWSSQGSTSGIAYNVEYFHIRDSDGRPYGNVIPEPLYIARVLPVASYRTF